MFKKKLALLVFNFCMVLISFAQAQNDLLLANEYFQQGEYEKAVGLFEKYSDNPQEVFGLHEAYVESLYKLERYKDAEKYFKKQLRRYPQEHLFEIDYGTFLLMLNRNKEANEHFEQFVGSISKNDQQIRLAARRFMSKGLLDYAEKLYLAGRKNGKDPFHYELANLYGAWGKVEAMGKEYLEIVALYPDRIEYVQNALQQRIKDEENFYKLEAVLYEFVQQKPENSAFTQMLTWYYLQTKEFGKAFLQAKALDKRLRLGGEQIMEIGRLTLKNEDYNTAIKIFEYVAQTYNGLGEIYPQAKRMLVLTKEELIKHTYPVDKNKIQSLANDYQQILNELGLMRYTVESARSLALLQAFYLENIDTAIVILEAIVKTPGIEKSLISQAKVDLGDIYLLKGEHWEATLLYSQVEKSQKNENLGHEAKLRNAKLSFYKGDFELSKAHLDVLKAATSREIANDALKLSLLIGDNIGLDTSETALKLFADAELLAFQNKYQEAFQNYDKIGREFPTNALIDEVYWAKAQALQKIGKFEDAIIELEKILATFKEDILGDDANYMIGRIYEDQLKNKEKAMEYYQRQLLDFKGSSFNVDARRRFRELRGDTTN